MEKTNLSYGHKKCCCCHKSSSSSTTDDDDVATLALMMAGIGGVTLLMARAMTDATGGAGRRLRRRKRRSRRSREADRWPVLRKLGIKQWKNDIVKACHIIFQYHTYVSLKYHLTFPLSPC